MLSPKKKHTQTWGPFGWKYGCGAEEACGLNITGWCAAKEGPICKKMNLQWNMEEKQKQKNKSKQFLIS